MGSIDSHEHDFNHNPIQAFDQQQMHQVSAHFKHRDIMSNIFKREKPNCSASSLLYSLKAKEQDYDYHKDIDIKPYIQHNIQEEDHTKDGDTHAADDIDNNDSLQSECNENVYDLDTDILTNHRNGSIGGNL